MGFESSYNASQVPDGVPVFVPFRALADNGTATFQLDHVANWIVVENFGTGTIVVGWTAAAAAAGTGKRIATGKAFTFTDIEAVTEVSIWAVNGSGTGDFDAAISYSRGGNAGRPALTVANGFPEYSASTELLIKPGVA